MEINELLSKLISFKTVYPNYQEVSSCLSFIEQYYQNTNLYIKRMTYNKDESILISNTLDKDLDVLFVGHIDVVPAEENDFSSKIINDKLYGRGSFDMKGHVAVMMKLLKDNSFKKKVGLLLTSDEERGGFNGTNKWINQLDYTCKIAIVPDAGNNFQIVEEEKGVLQLKVNYHGKEAHASQVWAGDNAIQKIMNLYEHLLTKYPLPLNSNDYRTSINLAKIMGGESPNMVASDCYAIFDIRHIASDSKEDFIKTIKEYNNKYNIEILAQGEPFLTHKENKYYQKFLDVYKEVLKQEPIFSKCESASDGRFFYIHNIPCILMNASGANLHAKDEYIELTSLDKLYNIYITYLHNLEK